MDVKAISEDSGGHTSTGQEAKTEALKGIGPRLPSDGFKIGVAKEDLGHRTASMGHHQRVD
jgi:hypothetical protein